MSLSDSGPRVNLLQYGHIGSFRALSENVGQGSAVFPPRWHLKVAIVAQWDTSLYFILLTRGRSFHLSHTCFPSDVFILLHDVLCHGSLSSL